MNTHLNDIPKAAWHTHALDAWRVIRQLRQDNDDLRLGLQAAVSIIAERDKTIARMDNANLHLRAQLQALMSGRTIAEERQQLERERLDAEIDARYDRRHERSVA